MFYTGIDIFNLLFYTGIDIDKEEDDEEVPPLFATQINDEMLWEKHRPEGEEDISKFDEGLSRTTLNYWHDKLV